MYFALRPENFSQILDHYEQYGFVVLTEVDPRLAATFRNVITSATGWSDDQIKQAGSGTTLTLSSEARARLTRWQTSSEIQEVLLSALGDLIVYLLGPVIHISRDFHPQIKRGAQQHILSGYLGDGLEVEAPYGYHQDFTSARVLTSPNAIVCWVPLNTCSENGLRIHPRSHTEGLLMNRWLPFDVPGIEGVGPYLDVSAEAGQVLLFNFLLVHATLRTGPKTRISCDIRFFPFCGILDSPARVIRAQPIEWIRQRLHEVHGETLKAPLYEILAYLGEPVTWPEIHRNSPLQWARYIEGMVRRDADLMAQAIEEFTNVECGFDPVSAYQKRFAQIQLERRPYQSVLPHLTEAQRSRCQEFLAWRGIHQ